LKLINWLNENFEKFMVALLFIIFSGIMILNVIMRFIFQNALSWASELVLVLFIWFVWFAVSYAFKERSHIRVTALISLLPEKIQNILSIIVDVFILVFFLMLIKSGIDLIGHFSVQGKTSLIIKYPMWIYYLSAPVGMALSIFRIIQNGYNDLKKVKKGNDNIIIQ
jgi:TRAP-type C4-dicarboxylate transport system permease small subunit